MKMSLLSLVKLLFYTLFFVVPAQAQKTQTHVLELQNRIETQIGRNLTNLISTQLSAGTFDVSARVKVVEVPSGNSNSKPDKRNPSSNDMPAGMDLGSIDVREVVSSYQKQIEELKAFKETEQKTQEPKFSVARIEIVVGLAEVYGDEYIEKMNDWLTKRIKLDYGSAAIVTVNKMNPLPIKETKPSWKDFVPMFAYAFIALALVVAAWMLSRGLMRLGEGTKNIIIEHKNSFSLEHNQKIEQKADDSKLLEHDNAHNAGSGMLDYKNNEQELLQAGEELVGKITYLCLELGKGVNDLVRFWLDNGNEGFLKTAILCDMIVGLKEKVNVETAAANTTIKLKYGVETAAAVFALKIPLDTDLASSFGVNLSEAYREAANMQLEAKQLLLEKIYWDLLQMKTLGSQNMRKPFDYLQSMNDMAYAEAINAQSDDAKALALMFGDAQKTKIFLSNVDDFEKEKIVKKMMNLTQVTKKQIWDVDAAMKIKLINSSMNPEASLVNLFPRTIDMLESLSPIDEVRVLRKTVPTLPDQGVTVKQQFTTLAFIDQWHEEYVARLVKVSTTSELVQLIQLIPECQNVVLNSCPEKMRMIVEDDLKVQTPDDNIIAKGIKQLKIKWKNICLAENLAMGKVVNLEHNVDWMKNAG